MIPRFAVVAFCNFLLVAGLCLQDAACTAKESLGGSEHFQPKWSVGDSWAVAVSQPGSAGPESRKVVSRWKFRVAEIERLAEKSFYKIEVSLSGRNAPPAILLWFDHSSSALTAVETRALVGGKMKTICQEFTGTEGQPVPVISSIAPFPIAMPVFQPSAKNAGVYSYSTGNQTAHEKGPSLGFLHVIQQQEEQGGQVHQIVNAMDGTFAKGEAATKEIRLTDGRQSIRQIWRAGLPWPALTETNDAKVTLVSSNSGVEQ